LISEFSSENIDFFLRKETINKNELKTNFLQDPPPPYPYEEVGQFMVLRAGAYYGKASVKRFITLATGS
jgi:hypothetical protein